MFALLRGYLRDDSHFRFFGSSKGPLRIADDLSSLLRGSLRDDYWELSALLRGSLRDDYHFRFFGSSEGPP